MSALVGASLLYKPWLVHTGGVVQQTVPPLRHLHKSLRNCIVCILSAWCVEALQDSSCEAHTHEIGVLRHSAMVLVFVSMFVAACCRAVWPQNSGDVHVCWSLASLVALVCLPQTQYWAANPLARQLTFADGAVRVCRVLLFAATYCGVVVAATPQRVFLCDPLVLSVRAFAASAWLLACPAQLLVLGPVYCTVLCLRRVKLDDGAGASEGDDASSDAERGGGGGGGVAAAAYYGNAATGSGGGDDDQQGGATPIVVEGRPAGQASTGTYVPACAAAHGSLSEDRKRALLAKLNSPRA